MITNEEGSPIAAQLNDKIISKETIDALLKKNNIEKKSSKTSIEFKEALDDYENGKDDTATEKFGRTLELYPEHTQAKKYLKEIEAKKTAPTSIIKTVGQYLKDVMHWFEEKYGRNMLIFAGIGIAMLSISVFWLFGKGKRKR